MKVFTNHTSINKVLVRKGDLDDITLQLYTEADYASFAYPSIWNYDDNWTKCV